MCPDGLYRVQLGAVGRRVQERGVVRCLQLVAGLVPTRAVGDQHGVCTKRHGGADFGPVLVRHVGIGERQDEGGASVASRVGRTEQVGQRVALVPRCDGLQAARGPYAGQRALIADASWMLPPEFEQLAAGVLSQRSVYEGGEVALKNAPACASCSGRQGRATRRRNRSRHSTSCVRRSASPTPKPGLGRPCKVGPKLAHPPPCSAKSGLKQTHAAISGSGSGGRNGLGPALPFRSDSPGQIMFIEAMDPVVASGGSSPWPATPPSATHPRAQGQAPTYGGMPQHLACA